MNCIFLSNLERPFNFKYKKTRLNTQQWYFFITMRALYTIIDYFFIDKNINNLFTPTVNFDVS